MDATDKFTFTLFTAKLTLPYVKEDDAVVPVLDARVGQLM